jgi:hypothetical protein
VEMICWEVVAGTDWSVLVEMLHLSCICAYNRMLLYTGFLAECFVADGDMDTVTYSGHPLASCMIHIYININTDVFFVHLILWHDPVESLYGWFHSVIPKWTLPILTIEEIESTVLF